MARFSSFLLFFSVLLTLVSTMVSQTVVESSPPLSQTVVESKITIGSSISAAAAGGAGASFWLSPSGMFSFGFYPLNSYNQEHIIGIWINNNPNRKTIVWSINQDESPLSDTTSLLLNHDGKFVIQFSNGAKEKPLFHQADSLLSSPISYASILDNGNLVFYNSNSTIIWESFDYPTDTILSGQTLHPKQSLTSESDGSSGKYTLIMKNNGNLMMYKSGVELNHKYLTIEWRSGTEKKNGSPIELKLDSTGHLYLGDWNGVIKKSLNNGSIVYKDGEEQQQQQQQDNKVILYRATLERDGVFRLYKEKIDGNASTKEEKEIHTLVWDTQKKLSNTAKIVLFVSIGPVVISVFGLLLYLCIIMMYRGKEVLESWLFDR